MDKMEQATEKMKVVQVEKKLCQSLTKNVKSEQTLTGTREDACIAWLNTNYNLYRNEITQQVENDGEVISEQEAMRDFKSEVEKIN